mgnify:CR=1 FL=1
MQPKCSLKWISNGLQSNVLFWPGCFRDSLLQQASNLQHLNKLALWFSPLWLNMIGIDHWRARIGSFSCRGDPGSSHRDDCDCLMCGRQKLNISQANCPTCSKKKSKCLKPHVKSSGDCEKASEEDLVTKSNCATVIEDKLVRGGVDLPTWWVPFLELPIFYSLRVKNQKKCHIISSL